MRSRGGSFVAAGTHPMRVLITSPIPEDPMTPPANSIAAGQHPMAKYAGLPGSVPRVSRSAESIKAFIMGRPGTGKTTFILSCPTGYHLNLDLTSNTSPNPLCMSWPPLDSESGQPIDPSGRPITLKWDHVEEIYKTLLNLAKTNQPRPTTIFIDSLSAMMRYLRPWIVENAQSIGISKNPAENWNALHGPSAYDWLYWRIVRFIEDLSSAGYGVYVFGHVGDKILPIGENKYATVVRPIITDNLWGRLFDLFEFVGATTTTTVSETREEEITTPRSSGPAIVRKVQRSYSRKAYLLCPQLDTIGPILKSRVNLPPTIELPMADSWSLWSRLYKEGSPLNSVPIPTVQEIPNPEA